MIITRNYDNVEYTHLEALIIAFPKVSWMVANLFTTCWLLKLAANLPPEIYASITF